MKFVFEEKSASGKWRSRFTGQLLRIPCRDCGQPVVFGAPFCAFHTDERFGVRISDEPRLGRGQKGLFATRLFYAGDWIVPYGGELMTEDELHERYGDHTAPYALELDDVYCQDSALYRSAGAHANHYHGLERVPNARFEARLGLMWLRAVRTIKPEEAILVDYGPDYEMNEPGVRYRTE